MFQLLKYKDVLLEILKRLLKLAPAIMAARNARKRLAERIAKGDLDDVLQQFLEADAAAEDFIDNG